MQNSVASPSRNISIPTPAGPAGKGSELMKSYNIAVIGGDGTGPEVVREAIKVLDAAAKKFSLKLNYTDYDIGGGGYFRTGGVVPGSVVIELRKFSAVLLRGIGHPHV